MPHVLLLFIPNVPQLFRAEKLKSELISKPTRTKNQVSSQTGELSPEGGPRACLTCIKSINTLINDTATTYSRKKTRPVMERGVQKEEGMAVSWEGRHRGPDSALRIVYTFQIELLDAAVRW